jgi:glycosyltransferase involved in cell wall biosynthesis
MSELEVASFGNGSKLTLSRSLGRPTPVLLTVRELNHGGVERDATKIALHIDRSRFEPHVATYRAEGIRYDELRAGGIPVLSLPVTSLKSRSAISSAANFCRYLKRHNIKVVHAFDSTAVFAAPLARVSRVPAIFSSQLGYRTIYDQRTHRQLRWIDRIVDAIVVNCEAMREHLVSDEGVARQRIELCYNGVNTHEFFPLETPKPPPVADASLVVGAICVLRPEKALSVLQEAFARIRHMNHKMKLLIVGSGPELQKLQSNSVRLDLTDASVFLPTTPDVVKFLRAIDIFVLCSYSEAFSNALLEAMACGCCVAGSQVGGTPELIGNNERGLLFRVGDPGDLADKLTQLISDPVLRKQLSSRAAEFAKTKLTVEIAAHRTAEIYDQMLRRKGQVT